VGSILPIRIALPDVTLGVLEIDGVSVAPADATLSAELLRGCERIQKQYSAEAVMELESIRAVRAMFRSWGIDPARYRPSAEALLRRVAQGKGLYRVSNVVDAGNLGSLETGWPYGLYNRAMLSVPIVFRAGDPGETYEGIGKQTWHLAGRPALADATGAFGSPISDSTRTMITESARDLLGVIYAPASAARAAIETAVSTLAARLERSAGGTNARVSLA
jgi:DNA/RNA-binding domain of Phe-tRNA-synthetase-like protein